MNKQKIFDKLTYLEINITSLAILDLLDGSINKETCRVLLKIADEISELREEFREGVKRK